MPVNRGFDTSSGFFGGGENHMNEHVGCATDFWKNLAPDSRNGTYDAYHYKNDLTEIIIFPNLSSFIYHCITYTLHCKLLMNGLTFTLLTQHVKHVALIKQWLV